MANIKPEDPESSLWQGYSLQPPAPSASHNTAYDASYQPAPLAIPYHGRPQKGSYRSVDIPALQTRPPPRDESISLTASPPTLSTHHSYPSLKRGFQGGGEVAYIESVQDFRDELPETAKTSINQDHRLLNFGRLPDKHTVIDSQGRIKQIELTAQIHGMFFLSELATPSGESLISQPELTCYRRNLFQISGNVSTPRGPLTFISERGERVPIISLEVCISATESVDGHVVKLIVIPWKTPPPNSPEIAPGQEQEPTPIPLVAFDEGSDANSEFTLFPIAYRRLQFRIATANNGRRRELQQHFTLHLNVVGTLASGAKVNVCETSTAPIVVRGRSPRNFQARKEIPLVGSSSSRGHPPDLHVSTNAMQQHPGIQRRATIPKPGALELPRSPFTFDSANLAGSPSITRQSAYPAWSAGHTPITPEQTTAPITPNYPASTISLDTYLQTNQPNSILSSPQHVQSPPIPMAAPPVPNRHYSFSSSGTPSGAPIRFVDSNPRPTKSPRHAAPPELLSNPYSDYGARITSPYNGNNSPLTTRTSEYFPATMPMPAWTTSPETGVVYGTAAQPIQPPTSQHYEFPNENYVKEENNPPQHYTWNQS